MSLYILIVVVVLQLMFFGVKNLNAQENADYECVTCLCHKEILGISGKFGNSYESCLNDEKCIVKTIMSYTDIYSNDCNCDGKFDCKDRLAIHLSEKFVKVPLMVLCELLGSITCKKATKS